jgi:hypothetical protein
MGCARCGIDQRGHGVQASADGTHTWQQPSQQQIKQRMCARRAARLLAEPPKYHATTAWAADQTGESGEPYCADCKTDGCHRWARIETRLDEIRWAIPHRAKHALHAQGGGWGDTEPF